MSKIAAKPAARNAPDRRTASRGTAQDLAAGDTNSPRSERRVGRRWDYQESAVAVAVEHPGGGISRLLVETRDIAEGGMGFLHHGFLHPGSHCVVRLIRRDGTPAAIPGTVASCRHVKSTTHQVGIRFARKVDPEAFVAVAGGPVTVTTGDLCGHILSIDTVPAEAKVVEQLSAGTEITVTVAPTPAQAGEMLRGQWFDIACVGSNEVDDACRQTVEAIRGSGFAGPVVLLTAETSLERLAQAKSAGADHLLARPVTGEAFLRLMARLHADAGAVVDRGAVGVLAPDPALAASAGAQAEALLTAMVARDVSRLRACCNGLRLGLTAEKHGPLLAQVDAATPDPDAEKLTVHVLAAARALSLTLRRSVTHAPAKAA